MSSVIAPGRATPTPGRVAAPAIGLAAISRAPGDGVAHVARLLERALGELAGAPALTIDLSPGRSGRVSIGERVRFAGRVVAAQVGGRVEGLVFSHLGIARVQRLVPPPARRPYAVFVHGIEAWEPDLGAGKLASLRAAAARIANSRYTARRVAATHPDAGPIESCPLALLPDAPTRDADVDRALVARVGARSAAIVGRMSVSERYKGHDELLECWPAVAERVGDAQLVIVGGGDDVERLRRKSVEVGVGERVLFTGRVSAGTLQAILARVALFAMPSRGEGFGIVYLEAMRAGLPCVAALDDAAGEVVADGETGLLVRQADRAGLAGAVARLLVDPPLAHALGEAGRRRYDAHFTFDRFRDRLGEILARTMEPRLRPLEGAR